MLLGPGCVLQWCCCRRCCCVNTRPCIDDLLSVCACDDINSGATGSTHSCIAYSATHHLLCGKLSVFVFSFLFSPVASVPFDALVSLSRSSNENGVISCIGPPSHITTHLSAAAASQPTTFMALFYTVCVHCTHEHIFPVERLRRCRTNRKMCTTQKVRFFLLLSSDSGVRQEKKNGLPCIFVWSFFLRIDSTTNSRLNFPAFDN